MISCSGALGETRGKRSRCSKHQACRLGEHLTVAHLKKAKGRTQCETFNFSLFKDLSNFEFVGVKVPLVILVWIDKKQFQEEVLLECVEGFSSPCLSRKSFIKKTKPRGELEIVLIWADFWIRREQLNFFLMGWRILKVLNAKNGGRKKDPFPTLFKPVINTIKL